MDPIRHRRDFLAAARGARQRHPAFVLQGRSRGDGGAPRLGLTATRKLGNAVVRNRIRRRLRAAARTLWPACARPDHDYVLIGRTRALDAPFATLVADLSDSFAELHRRTLSADKAIEDRVDG